MCYDFVELVNDVEYYCKKVDIITIRLFSKLRFFFEKSTVCSNSSVVTGEARSTQPPIPPG